jgi:hypothetical protein
MQQKMRTKEEMVTYLKYFAKGQITGTPCSVARRLLQEGQWFIGRANVSDCELTLSWSRKMRPRAGECFYNSQKFCLANNNFSYFEGYYFIGGLPMPHAWVVGKDNKVVDFTIEVVLRNAIRNKTDYDNRPPLYRGIRIETNILQLRLGSRPKRPNPLREPQLFSPMPS